MENEKTKELPRSPGEMPMLDYDTECKFIRNAFYDLSSMADEVEIQFEPSDDHCGCDDSDGEWHVFARRGGKSFEARHERIINALWFVIQHLEAKDRTDYENRERKREEALAKLTPDEKRLLHLNG